MGGDKKYSGYKSYQYLDKGVDYRDFKLANEVGRAESSHVIPLSKSEKQRVERVLKKCIVISLHDHPSIMPAVMSEVPEYWREGRQRMAYEGLSISGLDAVFDNLMDGTCCIVSKMGWKWNDVIYDLGMRLGDIAHQDLVIRGEKVEDILMAHDEGKIAIIPSLEAATMVENEVDRIDILYGLGVRMMGITYSWSNMLGSGKQEERDGGLTHFGHKVVKRMNQIGMAIDISHCGDRTALDVIEASVKPVFITHSGAKALCTEGMSNLRKMASDEVIINCAQRGGLIGIEAAPPQTITKKHPEQSVDSLMEHFEYCRDLVGIDHVAFGPDLLFGDQVGVGQVGIDHGLWPGSVESNTIEEVEPSEGLENPSETFANITRWLVRHGYSNHQIEEAIGGNILRVLKEVWWI